MVEKVKPNRKKSDIPMLKKSNAICGKLIY